MALGWCIYLCLAAAGDASGSELGFDTIFYSGGDFFAEAHFDGSGGFSYQEGGDIWRDRRQYGRLVRDRQSQGGFFVASASPSEKPFGAYVHLIKWQKRRYLVPDAHVLAFAQNVRTGRESRAAAIHNRFFLLYLIRLGDERKVVSGSASPSLPAGFPADLYVRPIAPRVVGVAGENIVVDHGYDEGLRIGSLLDSEPGPTGAFRIRVTLAFRHKSNCELLPSTHAKPRLPAIGDSALPAAHD